MFKWVCILHSYYNGEGAIASQLTSKENRAALSSHGFVQWYYLKENRELSGEKSGSQSYSLIFHTSNCLFASDPINNTFPKQKSSQSLQRNAGGKGNFQIPQLLNFFFYKREITRWELNLNKNIQT